jgi:hypothetical protein
MNSRRRERRRERPPPNSHPRWRKPYQGAQGLLSPAHWTTRIKSNRILTFLRWVIGEHPYYAHLYSGKKSTTT